MNRIMNIHKKVRLCCLMGSAAFNAVYGSGEPDTLLTIDGAVDYAVRYSLTMQSANNSYESSLSGLGSARQALLPTAQASLSANRRQSLDNTSSATSSAGVSVGADYTFSPSGYRYYLAAKKSNMASQHDVEEQRKEIAAQTLIQFVKVAGAARLIAVEEDNVAYQKRKSEEIDALFAQGIKARSDVLQQRVNSADASIGLLDAVRQYRIEMLSLLEIVGLPVSDRYGIDTTAMADILLFCSGEVPSGLLAEKETDGIAGQKLRVATAQTTLEGRRLAYIPSLSFSAGLSADDDIDRDIGSDVSGSLQAGVSLGIPILDQRQRRIQLDNAGISLRQEKIELDRMRQTLDLAVKQALLDDEMARRRVTVSHTRCEASQEALDAMEERYRAGVSTLVELNAVQKENVSAQSALVQARLDCITSRMEVLRQAGQIDLIIDFIEKAYGKQEVKE